MMRASLAQGGAQVTTGDSRRGRSHWVHGRAGKPCRRCGTLVRKADQESYGADRVTYWCPSCQPAVGQGVAGGGRRDAPA
jgi:formamidopyrimidine-DNA glycosylase